MSGEREPDGDIRPALGEALATTIVCGDAPYTCDGFDPADWPEGQVPDLSSFSALNGKTE